MNDFYIKKLTKPTKPPKVEKDDYNKLTIPKIKDLIEEYNIENDNEIKKYKTLRKAELINILKKYKIKVSPTPKLSPPTEISPTPTEQNIVIKKKEKIKKDDYNKLTIPLIKELIEEYNLENDNVITKYKTLKKSYLIDILKKYKIDISNVVIPKRTRTSTRKDILQFRDEEQKNFETDLENNERFKNPLQALNMYITNEGTEEHLELQKHQKNFIKQFIFSNVVGAIVFHGVGSGKTLTAVVSSYLYLKMYPKNEVYIISPSALLYNFSDEMIKYGLNPRDKRYHFFTYDKFINMKKEISECLVIIDEAHNFRTEIIEKEDPETLEQTIVSNKRGYAILKNATSNAHKVILLTGTLFVNKIYDIENLLAMSEQRGPLQSTTFNNMLKDVDNYPDYFNFKISYYPPVKNKYFPKANNYFVPIVMKEDFLEKYENIEKQDKELEGYALKHFEEYNKKKTKKVKNEKTFNPFTEDDLEDEEKKYSLKTFYNGVINASNSIDGLNNPKIKYITNLIVNRHDEKFIIYSSLYDAGIQLLKKSLKQKNISYSIISGNETAKQKDFSKFRFNSYNFEGQYPFKDERLNDKKVQEQSVRVLLITKAGAEGVSTINCNNIILLDAQWNEAVAEQIIARAIRFKSHYQLPEKKRFVDVIRLMLIKPNEKELVKKTFQNKSFKNWVELLQNINTQAVDDKGEKTLEKTPSIDLKLMILSHAKQKTIDDFVKLIGNGIKEFEKYTDSEFLKYLMSKEHENMTEEEQIKIYQEGYTHLNQNVITNTYTKNLLNLALANVKTGREKQQILQQFFTSEILVKEIYEKSKIMNDDRQIKVLEPTAGIGNLIKPLLVLDKDITIDLVEYDQQNRIILEKLKKEDNIVLNLLVQNDFLKTDFKQKYDYIFMNPPFNLRKSENPKLLGQVKDIDFVRRAYAGLKVGGEIIAITGTMAENTSQYTELSKYARVEKFHYKDIKFSKGRNEDEYINMNILILKITKEKENDKYDDYILSQNFYKGDSKRGKNPELEILDIPEIPDENEIRTAINKSLGKTVKVKKVKEV